MALTSERIRAVESIVDDLESPSDRLPRVQGLESAGELQHLAYYYNWDDGFAVPTAIANHPHCDLGVALALFWLAEGITWYLEEVPLDEFNQDWVSFCRLITNRILDGHYKKCEVRFASGLGVARLHKYRKLGVPDALLLDV